MKDAELAMMTMACLTSLRLALPDEVILVDDGSPIKIEPPIECTEVELLDNSGYSAACNAGLEACTGDIIIIGNNDLTFDEKWLRGLLCVLEEGFDVATCWTTDQKYTKEPVIAEWDKFGSLFAMTRQVYETIGGFDETFRGYFADTDYQQRLKKAGFRIGINKNIVVEHKAKATYSKTDPDDEEYNRAKLLFEMKYEYLI